MAPYIPHKDPHRPAERRRDRKWAPCCCCCCAAVLHLEMLYPTEAIQAHGRKYKGIVYCMFLLTLCPKRLAVNKSPLMGDRSFFPKPLLCNYIWKMSSFVLGPEIKKCVLFKTSWFLSVCFFCPCLIQVIGPRGPPGPTVCTYFLIFS